MALTYIGKPNIIGLSKNPVIYTLQTDNEFSTVGVAVEQTIELDMVPANGDQLSLAWLNGTRDLTFTFSNNPDDSGLELKTQTGLALSAYISDILLDELRSNYLINKDFIFSALGNNKILFQARDVGTAYAFSMTSSGSYNPVLDIFNLGSDPVRRENFRIISEMKIRYKGATSWDRAEIELIPINGTVTFNLEYLLEPYDKFRLCSPLRTIPLNISNQVIEYQNRFGEAYGTFLEVKRMMEDDNRFAIRGGLNLKDRLDFNFKTDILPDFLTHRFFVRLRPGQPYFLNFFNDDVQKDVELKGRFYYGDGSNEVKVIHNQSLDLNSLTCFPVGHAVLLNNADAQKELLRVSVWLKELAGAVLTSEVSLKIFDKGTLDEIIISYRNAYGVQETEFFAGVITKSMSASQEVYDIWQRHDAIMEDSRFTVVNKRYTYALRLRSGHRSEEEAEVMADLLASDKHYLLSGGKYVPVIIDYDELEVTETFRNNLHTFELEVRLTEDKNYSDVGNRIG